MEPLESDGPRPKQTRSFYKEFQELQGFHFVRMRKPKGAKKRRAWALGGLTRLPREQVLYLVWKVFGSNQASGTRSIFLSDGSRYPATIRIDKEIRDAIQGRPASRRV